MPRRFNHRLVKIHRSYTVEEAARLFAAHKHTIRNWIKDGLPTVDDRRPTLVHGQALVAYLVKRREQTSRPCASGEIYCVKCRVPRRPARAEYVAYSTVFGALRSTCPVCGTVMHRRVSLANLDQARGDLEVTVPKEPQHIRESSSPFVNCALEPGGETDGDE